MIPTGFLAAFYIALLSLHFMDLGVKVKEKSLLGKKNVSERNKASQLCPLLVQQENEA